MLEAVAEWWADAVRRGPYRDAAALKEGGPRHRNFNCSFIFGGQIRGESDAACSIVYSAGQNFIEATAGNNVTSSSASQYGKPIIEPRDLVHAPGQRRPSAPLISRDSHPWLHISVVCR